MGALGASRLRLGRRVGAARRRARGERGAWRCGRCTAACEQWSRSVEPDALRHARRGVRWTRRARCRRRFAGGGVRPARRPVPRSRPAGRRRHASPAGGVGATPARVRGQPRLVRGSRRRPPGHSDGGVDVGGWTLRSIAAAASRAFSLPCRSPSQSSIMAVDRIMAVGLAMPCPAMSGAEPWLG